MRNAPAIEVTDLVKFYGRHRAVNGLTFAVQQNEIFALLGRNGAGKSTTMKMLSTLMVPSAGRAKVAGFDTVREPREVRHHIGFVFQESTLDAGLTVVENLRFHATLYGTPRHQVAERIEYAMKLLGLEGHEKALVARLSGGLARRLEICRALLHKPKILFLDEPSLGLDPPTRTRLWQEIKHLRDRDGLTVLMTTHYMDEVENVDRLAIVNAGELVAIDTPSKLKAAVGLDRIRLSTTNNAIALRQLVAHDIPAWAEGEVIVCCVPDAERGVGRLLSLIDVPATMITVQRPSLDDVFVHFTEMALAREAAESGTGGAHRRRAKA
ncbi:ABC transporter ATP-binding protein [Actinocatenispora rupis]|uniref:Daunorubicin resistance protein DrrA family ABC transporter ATP-binding protein n=1 Tax=Actinocatenispora rupis TaxID=519421 RepID=A0A8J3N910_9ACTN|nr:ABC transporter ATP-binding protein [Actinocatenispora rupis]GID10656.1 daunorubicin resistance protein DrrA family ABC transporter ATP-binding protein [Actinocatenispora rupis]